MLVLDVKKRELKGFANILLDRGGQSDSKDWFHMLKKENVIKELWTWKFLPWRPI